MWQTENAKERDKDGGRVLYLWMQFCVSVCVRYLALPPIPPPSPPHPPGRRFSAAGSAGDTRQTPDPPSARSSWPETIREDTEKKVCVCVSVCVGVLKMCGGSSSRSKAREDAKMKGHSRGENEVPKELRREKSGWMNEYVHLCTGEEKEDEK